MSDRTKIRFKQPYRTDRAEYSPGQTSDWPSASRDTLAGAEDLIRDGIAERAPTVEDAADGPMVMVMIKLKTSLANERAHFQAGQVYPWERADARRLIERGFAELVRVAPGDSATTVRA